MCIMQPQSRKLSGYLQTHMGIKSNSDKTVKKNQDSNSRSGNKKATFGGKECVELLTKWEGLIDFVFSSDFYGRPLTVNDTNQRAQAEDVWSALHDLHTIMHHTLPAVDNHLPSQEDRNDLADKYQEIADRFVRLYSDLRGGVDKCLYIHVVKVEIAKFIRMYGNLVYYSCQGAEHLHVLVKYAMRWLTNKKAGERVKQAFNWVLLYNYHKRAFPLPRGTGKARGPKRKAPDVM